MFSWQSLKMRDNSMWNRKTKFLQFCGIPVYDHSSNQQNEVTSAKMLFFSVYCSPFCLHSPPNGIIYQVLIMYVYVYCVDFCFFPDIFINGFYWFFPFLCFDSQIPIPLFLMRTSFYSLRLSFEGLLWIAVLDQKNLL